LKNLLKLWPYALILIVLFYVVPAVFQVLALAKDWFISLLLMYNPATCLFVSAVYSYYNGFKWPFLLLAPVLFLPAVFLFYNSSALIYAALYLLICVCGMGLGLLNKFGYISKKQ